MAVERQNISTQVLWQHGNQLITIRCGLVVSILESGTWIQDIHLLVSCQWRTWSFVWHSKFAFRCKCECVYVLMNMCRMLIPLLRTKILHWLMINLLYYSTMQNTEGGRKLNQAMVSTGRAVATTGRAVGEYVKHIGKPLESTSYC